MEGVYELFERIQVFFYRNRNLRGIPEVIRDHLSTKIRPDKFSVLKYPL